MKGRLQVETVGSPALKGNPLGDPSVRQVPVYLPPSYGRERGRRYPVIYYLTGFTGTGRGAVNYHPWKENIAERLDRLIAEGEARECLLVIPDAFTAYGGSQYLDSSATGRYEEHVARELVAFVDDKFSVAAQARGRALLGKSSGGFGALTLGMRHPDVFSHVACHSGDMGFELCYGADIPKVVGLLARFGGGADRAITRGSAASEGRWGAADRFAREFLSSRRKDLYDHALVNMIAMAACYSPDPKSPGGFALPFDAYTGEFLPAVWKRWKALDPVEAAPRHRRALKSLRTLYLDCGRKDEFHLHLGARRLSRLLKRLGVPHVYEEHDGGHFDMADRYDRSLALLSRRMRV